MVSHRQDMHLFTYKMACLKNVLFVDLLKKDKNDYKQHF